MKKLIAALGLIASLSVSPAASAQVMNLSIPPGAQPVRQNRLLCPMTNAFVVAGVNQMRCHKYGADCLSQGYAEGTKDFYLCLYHEENAAYHKGRGPYAPPPSLEKLHDIQAYRESLYYACAPQGTVYPRLPASEKAKCNRFAANSTAMGGAVTGYVAGNIRQGCDPALGCAAQP